MGQAASNLTAIPEQHGNSAAPRGERRAPLTVPFIQFALDQRRGAGGNAPSPGNSASSVSNMQPRASMTAASWVLDLGIGRLPATFAISPSRVNSSASMCRLGRVGVGRFAALGHVITPPSISSVRPGAWHSGCIPHRSHRGRVLTRVNTMLLHRRSAAHQVGGFSFQIVREYSRTARHQ
jgi:hypothetical protein